MATTLTFGGVDLLAGLQLAPGGIRSSDSGNGQRIETYDLIARSSIANNINYFDLIDDQIEQAIRYTNNQLNDTPVYLVEYANGETAKRAVVYSATLMSESRNAETRLMKFNHIFAKLAVTRGPWESTSTTTGLSLVSFDWDDPTQAIASVPGTMAARMDNLRVVATATNDETTPLTEGWVGIREEYLGYDNFNPVWELEAGTIEDAFDVALVDVADSNTSPTGSSTGNAIECDFDNVATMKKRHSITLSQVTTGIISNDLVTNGGFETGDFTGWTRIAGATGGMTVSGANPRTGTYSLLFSSSADEADGYTQDIAVTYGLSYSWSFSIDVDVASLDTSTYIKVEFLDGSKDLVSSIGGGSFEDTVLSGYQVFSGTNACPLTAEYIRFTIVASTLTGLPTRACCVLANRWKIGRQGVG